MDVPLKFVYGWLVMIIVIYSISGYIYNTESETPAIDTEKYDADLNVIDIVAGAVTWFIDTLIALFSVLFFAIPNIPIEATIVLNIIFQPLNIIWIIAIYPFIKDLAHLVIESGKTVIELIDAIIPF